MRRITLQHTLVAALAAALFTRLAGGLLVLGGLAATITRRRVPATA